MSESIERTALVTGGSRGIGRAVVERLARDGYDVAFCYSSDTEAAEKTQQSAGQYGTKVLGFRTDVSDADSVRAMVAQVNDALAPVDVLVASAGIVRDSPLILMQDDHWNQVVDVNLTGTYNVCRAVAFDMAKRRSGAIIALSSVAGEFGNPGQTNYAATKAGVVGFIRALAKEVGRYGIRVNAVSPGFIETDMLADLKPDYKKKMVSGVPLGRMGTTEEVADLVSFLVSDRASYITRAVIPVDGGIVI